MQTYTERDIANALALISLKSKSSVDTDLYDTVLNYKTVMQMVSMITDILSLDTDILNEELDLVFRKGE